MSSGGLGDVAKGVATGGLSLLGNGPNMPGAPNYGSLAQQQAALDKAAADAQTQANRPNQVNPFGQISWEKDANGNWTQTESYDPMITSLEKNALASQLRQFGQLDQQGNFNAPNAVQYDPNSGNATGDAMFQSVESRLLPQQNRATDALATRLRLQGLQPGTEAYDRAMKNMLTANGDVNAKAALDARVASGQESRANYATEANAQQTDYQQKLQQYMLPWQRLQATQSVASGVQMPQFASFNQATGYKPADMMGAAQNQYGANMNKYNGQMQKKGNLLNAGATVAAAAI